MKNLSSAILLIMALVAEVSWSAGPINFTNTNFISRLKNSSEHPIDLYQSIDGAHPLKYFTARTLVRLSATPLSASDQRAVRNEICASNELQFWVFQTFAGSLAVYEHNNAIISIADTSFAGTPLDRVLRTLSHNPSQSEKAFFALYYIVAITRVLEELELTQIAWNNLELRNFYVRPDGKLHAFDMSDATRIPTTKVADLQRQLNQFMGELLPKVLSLLFPREPAVAAAAHQTILTRSRGGDTGKVSANWKAALAHNWSLDDIKGVLQAASKLRAVSRNPNRPFAGGLLNAGVATGTVLNQAANVTAFNNNVEAFLNRRNHRPFVATSALATIDANDATLANGDHQGATPATRGNSDFGIGAEVLDHLIDPATGNPYTDLAALCNGWTGK